MGTNVNHELDLFAEELPIELGDLSAEELPAAHFLAACWGSVGTFTSASTFGSCAGTASTASTASTVSG